MFSIWGVEIAASPYVPGQPDRRLRVEPTRRSTPSERHASGDPVESHVTRGGGAVPSAGGYASADEQASQHRPVTKAADLMSAPVFTLAAGADLGTAVAAFRSRRFRHVPVVQTDGTLVGMLSDRDLWHPDPRGAGAQVQHVMATPVLSASPTAPVREIARVMLHEHVGAIPIVDAVGAPVGIVTRSDILRALVRQAPLELWA